MYNSSRKTDSGTVIIKYIHTYDEKYPRNWEIIEKYFSKMNIFIWTFINEKFNDSWKDFCNIYCDVLEKLESF